MTSYKKVKLGLRALSIENLSYLCRATIKLVQQQEDSFKADERLKKAFQKLEVDLRTFDQVEQTTAKGNSVSLTTLDKQRDRDFSDLKTYLKLKSRHRQDRIKQAAEKLYLLLQPYADLSRRPQSEQTTLLLQLFQQLDNKENRSLATLIGATDYITALKESHEAFDTAYLKKIEGKSQKASPSRLDLRRALEDDYNNIYAYLLALEHFGQDSFHRPLLGSFNDVRQDFLDKQKKTSKTKQKKD